MKAVATSVTKAAGYDSRQYRETSAGGASKGAPEDVTVYHTYGEEGGYEFG